MNFLQSTFSRVQNVAQQLKRLPVRMCRASVSSLDAPEETEWNISEHIKKQVLQTGLHYLSDVDRLRENMTSRKSNVDLNKLVSYNVLSAPNLHSLTHTHTLLCIFMSTRPLYFIKTESPLYI